MFPHRTVALAEPTMIWATRCAIVLKQSNLPASSISTLANGLYSPTYRCQLPTPILPLVNLNLLNLTIIGGRWKDFDFTSNRSGSTDHSVHSLQGTESSSALLPCKVQQSQYIKTTYRSQLINQSLSTVHSKLDQSFVLATAIQS